MESIECSECKAKLPLKVCKSGGGYYIGYFCNNCGPYDRVSFYYETQEEADEVLKEMT